MFAFTDLRKGNGSCWVMDRELFLDPWVWVRIITVYTVVAVLAGAIAYLGNTWGKEIGKKRLSIFGMRPKHTSNFITTITGSLIAVTTLTLILLFSDSARQMLAGVHRLRAQLISLEQQVRDIQVKLAQSYVVWGVGQIISQGTLEPRIDAATQRARILTQLELANSWSISKNNDIARRKGEEPLDPLTTQLLVWDETQLSEVAAKMLTEEQVVGVQIVAERNCLYKDKVPVKLALLPVTRIFHEGELVASQVLQPDNPELLLKWIDFVAAVKESALRRGMMEVNDSLGGGLTQEDLARLIDDLKHLSGPGRVSAIASMDLYQTSRLAVRIKVEPAGALIPSRTRPL